MKFKRKICNGLLLRLMALILIAIFANSASATTYYCNSCSDCESKINSASAGDIVKLNADIINQTGICINWGNSNVEFDCQGHLINGDFFGGGIYIDWESKNTIKNCIITGLLYGISLSGSSNNTIVNNTISSNMMYGISLNKRFSLGSSGNTIANNTFINSGLDIDRLSFQNNIANNTVNGKPLVYLEGVSDIEITDAGQVIIIRSNNITVKGLTLSNTSTGVELVETNNSIISYNNISNNQNYGGIVLWLSFNNAISNNSVVSNSFGVSLSGSSNNRIVSNNIKSNEVEGIFLAASSNNNKITNNTLSSNVQYGISFMDSSNNIITNNTVVSSIYGISFESSNNNTINSNGVCFNMISDFILFDFSMNQGHDNTCNKPDGWNDTGTTGCTYSCSGAECPVKGDKPPCDGNVSDFEILDYINQWAKGNVEDFDLLVAIDTWAKG